MPLWSLAPMLNLLTLTGNQLEAVVQISEIWTTASVGPGAIHAILADGHPDSLFLILSE